MRVRIDDIQEKAGLHKRVPLSIMPDPVEMGGQVFHFDQPFAGEAEIWNAGDSLLVKGELSGAAIVSCSRCLSPFQLPLRVRFEEDFVEGQEQLLEAEEKEEEAERSITYYQGNEIDLSEPLRDHILLELPMKPLCNETCRGLCPMCGANWNNGQCECKETPDQDPRLSVFQDLLRKPDINS